jgi:hypothetical protein
MGVPTILVRVEAWHQESVLRVVYPENVVAETATHACEVRLLQRNYAASAPVQGMSTDWLVAPLQGLQHVNGIVFDHHKFEDLQLQFRRQIEQAERLSLAAGQYWSLSPLIGITYRRILEINDLAP